ncbi:hypothetical protein K438DRAFT_2115954 [Mycena galopus ATCC 62051]|nr:hypothetical protein K438DRAFT_2115954 [Mycena galopus ATCC 62051]
MSARSTPPPQYTARVDNLYMDTSGSLEPRTETNTNNPVNMSDTESDNDIPDLIPVSDDERDHFQTNSDDNSQNDDSYPVHEGGEITTLIQHIHSLNITNESHRGAGKSHKTTSASAETGTAADSASMSTHPHVTKLRGEARILRQAVRDAVLDSFIQETGRNHRYTTRAGRYRGRNGRFCTLLERLHRLELLLRRLELFVHSLNRQLKYTQCECKLYRRSPPVVYQVHVQYFLPNGIP